MSAEQDREPALSQTSVPAGAVFLSYASQDAEPARKICDALRAAGIEVWFDQSELRGGDAWDQSIRKQIKTCALFLPLISKNTHERAEGYFRLEWKLAVDRSHLITAHKAFLVPVVIDDTQEDEEHVPDKFRDVQWTRLPGGEAPPEFVSRIQQLMSRESSHSPVGAWRPAAVPAGKSSRLKLASLGVIVALVAVAAYLFVERPWAAKSAAPADFAPPPHSIAVLPFVNMSGDKEQEYFSDGLSEELLNSLAEIEGLQVAGRTSSFYFKGEHADLAAIAHKLNVATVLEGSVRRSADTVRITAQLINAVTGFHLWSKTYNRSLGDVLKLQTEIATSVASALKVTLLGDVSAKIERGGTRNPEAFDAYLRASRMFAASHDRETYQASIAAFTDAIRGDPHYALAFAGRSFARNEYGFYATGPEIRENLDQALTDAREAIAVSPELAEGHLALARSLVLGALDFAQALGEYERAMQLAPGNERVLSYYGIFAVQMGRTDVGLGASRRAVMLDPLNPEARYYLGLALLSARRYVESVAAFSGTLALDPDDGDAQSNRGFAYYELGDLERAGASCEAKSEYWVNQQCLAIIYERIGRRTDAQAVFVRLRSARGDDSAVEYAEVYAQWGNKPKALEWLGTAVRLRYSGLITLKTDPLLDPLRNEPRFQAIERALKFPQ